MVKLTQKELAEIVGLTDRQLRRINDAEKRRGKELLIKTEGGGYDATIFIERWFNLKLEEKKSNIVSIIDKRAKKEIEKAKEILTFGFREESMEE